VKSKFTRPEGLRITAPIEELPQLFSARPRRGVAPQACRTFCTKQAKKYKDGDRLVAQTDTTFNGYTAKRHDRWVQLAAGIIYKTLKCSVTQHKRGKVTHQRPRRHFNEQ